MASPREIEVPVTLSLQIPKQFGKTLLAEQIQAFIIEAMAQAWDEGWNAGDWGWDGDENPYRKK